MSLNPAPVCMSKTNNIAIGLPETHASIGNEEVNDSSEFRNTPGSI